MKTRSDISPLLSVLVIGYKRQEFIMDAIKSVLYQSIQRNDYEIICVIGFHDEELSSFLQSNNIKEIFCDGKMGQTIVSGIEACSTDIVVFIEDDDQFRNDKLEKVLEAFQDYNCIYYHNNNQLIDEKSRLILDDISPYNKQITRPFVWHPNSRINYILKHRGDFNMSSIAVSKEILHPYLNALSKIETSPDSIIFFLLMQNKMPFCFDIEKTTFYRIHNSETNNIEHTTPQKILYTSLRFYKSRVIAYETMRSAFVRKVFLGYLLESKFGAYIDGQLDLKPRLTEEIKFFSIALARKSKFYMMLLFATYLTNMFPIYVRKIKESRRSKRYKRWNN